MFPCKYIRLLPAALLHLLFISGFRNTVAVFTVTFVRMYVPLKEHLTAPSTLLHLLFISGYCNTVAVFVVNFVRMYLPL